MAKLKTYSLTRPDDISEERTFTDPLQPGNELTLRLTAAADYGADTRIAERAQQLITDFLDGRNGGAAAPLPGVGGRPVTLDKRTCCSIAALLVMEDPQEGESRFEFLNWREITVMMPTAFGEIVEWAESLMSKARGQVPNEPRASMESGSGSPSISEQAITPSS